MLHNYLQVAKIELLYVGPIALIIFCVFTFVKFLVRREYEFKPLSMFCEFAWIITVLLILRITGIIGDYFGTTSFFYGIVNFSFNPFKEKLSIATLLNIILFIPFGFLSAIIFKRFRDNWIYGVLIGFIFSVIIEFYSNI